MHAYLATVCRDLGAELVHIGGVADHVHIVTTLPRTVSQAQLVEQIKKPELTRAFSACLAGGIGFLGRCPRLMVNLRLWR
jgi:REP element-mobilizing transposase RayT